MVRSQRPSGIRGIRFPSKTHGHAPVCRPRIETISKAHGFPPRTVARNSLKPAKKDREQKILLFPAFHRFPVPQTSPARTTAETGSQRQAHNVPCPAILPDKSFWKG